MPEDTEVVDEQPEVVAPLEASEATDALAGEGSAPEKIEPGEVKEEETASPPQDRDIELEIGGKVFSMKQSEAIQILENHSKVVEREQALAAKEKSFNHYNTKEGQRNAAFRKSV